ncbi:hypothetical protein ACP70R_046413 [Stipagrostis hirtigluma subsp. patula]
MMSFLSKHVKRYQSLDDKIDDLCTRIRRASGAGAGSGVVAPGSRAWRWAAFQLQRQKLLETQSRIAPGLARRDSDDGVDMKRLMDVQRGLEVRIAWIIRDLEGTISPETHMEP